MLVARLLVLAAAPQPQLSSTGEPGDAPPSGARDEGAGTGVTRQPHENCHSSRWSTGGVRLPSLVGRVLRQPFAPPLLLATSAVLSSLLDRFQARLSE